VSTAWTLTLNDKIASAILDTESNSLSGDEMSNKLEASQHELINNH